MRLILVLAGAVTLIVGVVGLLTPVSVSPELQTVGCGSAVSPDFSAARTANDYVSALPQSDEVVVGIDYTELCRMELKDRRILSITLAAGGVLILAAGMTMLVRSRQKTG